MPRGPRPVADSVEAVLGEVQRIEDPDTLFAWALRILPLRNRLSDVQRGALHAAFFEKAEAVRADPELMVALDQLTTGANALALSTVG